MQLRAPEGKAGRSPASDGAVVWAARASQGGTQAGSEALTPNSALLGSKPWGLTVLAGALTPPQHSAVKTSFLGCAEGRVPTGQSLHRVNRVLGLQPAPIPWVRKQPGLTWILSFP